MWWCSRPPSDVADGKDFFKLDAYSRSTFWGESGATDLLAGSHAEWGQMPCKITRHNLPLYLILPACTSSSNPWRHSVICYPHRHRDPFLSPPFYFLFGNRCYSHVRCILSESGMSLRRRALPFLSFFFFFFFFRAGTGIERRDQTAQSLSKGGNVAFVGLRSVIRHALGNPGDV